MKKGFIDFIKDKLGYTISIFSSMSLVIIFYKLNSSQKIEVLYPALLVLFVYVVTMIISFIKYMKFNKLLSSINYNTSSMNTYKNDFKTRNNQQNKIIHTINKLNRSYKGEIQVFESEHKTRNEIISQIVHNTKTSVSVIELITGECFDNNHPHVDKKELNKIKAENHKIQEGLEQVLSYLRLGEFQNDYIIENVNIVQQVRNTVNLKKDYFIYNNVFPKFLTDQEEAIVLTDKKWNSVILEQIITNAVKYSYAKEEKGNVFFEIKIINNTTQLIISDNGIGISQFDLENVFKPYFTGENGRKIKSSSGIGLYICHRIAEKLGHKIEISSEVGRGTKVIISYLSKA
ncbi:sensor histidine kinase [Oceanirhabdus sp. W0125-5]|uniref:sensor histidine kinase n=1 Tax=Oceanirhabdus sp. W0125-5 TaxID=2999116 RepID=UPI0022F31761|nr:sensor histidine kinase [Oceanirhabdus sp. W0125-5]WBW96746.1 sensor histidine kinase [Oceanirhabdus sp. W0125-5]